MFFDMCSFLIYLVPTYNTAPNHPTVSFTESQNQGFPMYFLLAGVIMDAAISGLYCIINQSYRRIKQKEGCLTMGERRKVKPWKWLLWPQVHKTLAQIIKCSILMLRKLMDVITCWGPGWTVYLMKHGNMHFQMNQPYGWHNSLGQGLYVFGTSTPIVHQCC